MGEIGAYIDKAIFIISGLAILLFLIPKKEKEIVNINDEEKKAKIRKQNTLFKFGAYFLILLGIIQIILI